MVRKKPVATRNDPVTTPTSDVRRLIRFAGDVSPEPTQSLVKARVSAVDVVCLADRRDPVGNQTGDDQGSVATSNAARRPVPVTRNPRSVRTTSDPASVSRSRAAPLSLIHISEPTRR